jgi:glycosyltransferase involved in cell wall biosynthesis
VFLAGMVAANVGNPSQHRKAFPEVFAAMAEFAANHEDVWFYCHSQGNPRPGGGGINLYELARRRGLPEDRVRIPLDENWDRGIPAAFVALVYQALDVALLTSMGEGFGVPLVEAQACGVPVIASNHSAMTELTHAGWLVPGQPANDEAQKSDFLVPFISGIVDALEAAYDSRDDQVIRAAAASFGREYDADLITDRSWRPALEQLAQPAVKPNRAQRRANQRKKVTA